jgi:hypothetical protein
VTLALIHGGQPDALVLCHEPTRTHLRGLPGYGMSTLEELRDLSLQMARIANPACEAVGISINTKALPEDEARDYLAETEARMGLPATDPFRYGAGPARGRAGGALMITVTPESFRLAEVFTISRGSRTEAKVLTVRVARDGVTGGANACPTRATARASTAWRPRSRAARGDRTRAELTGRASARRGPQRGRLRALGLGGEAGRAAGLGARGAAACRGRS